MTSTVTRAGVVVPVRLDRSGRSGPTPGQARGPRWRSLGGGWYLPAAVDGGPLEQRIVEAVVGCGPGAAATGWAALAWCGARWFGGFAGDGRTPLPVPVALPDQREVRPRPGVRISEDWLFADDVVLVDGLPVTIPERSVSFEARRAQTLVEAVRAIDMAAFDDLVDLAGLAAYAERLVARPGVRMLRAALALAEENAWSPLEVVMRLQWGDDRHDARLLCNAPVFDAEGRHLFTPDLLDPEAGVAGEYDGLLHLADGVRRRDLARDALARDHEIEVVTMMSPDLQDMAAFRSRLVGAYRRAERRGASRRTWTLDRPDWWVDTSTVARRRALEQAERHLWLRRRSA